MRVAGNDDVPKASEMVARELEDGGFEELVVFPGDDDGAVGAALALSGVDLAAAPDELGVGEDDVGLRGAAGAGDRDVD